MRITNKMITNRYTKDLNSSLETLNNLSEKVETGRKFSRGYEDPIGAVKAYRLRRDYYKNEDYLNNIQEADSTLTSAESNLMGLNKNLKTVYTKYLKGSNGTLTQDDRKIITNELKNIQDSIVATLNSSFNDKYLFSGNSMEKAPFSTKDVGGYTQLFYKGVNVSIADQNAAVGTDERKAYDALVKLSKESNYLDLGLSLKVDEVAGKNVIDKNSVFDLGMPGINFLGFGQLKDKDGMAVKDKNGNSISSNIYDLITNIRKELDKPNIDTEELMKYTQGFDKQNTLMLKQITSIGSKTQYIDFLKTRTTDNNLNLNKKMFETECVKPEIAIMDWKMQEFTYTAALQMGTKIIQPSFLDYMR